MNIPHLYYLKEKNTTWFNPSYGLNMFWNEYGKLSEKLGKCSHDYLWNHRDLKRAKEIYATSIIAKAMEKQEKIRWWITKPKNDPPDGVIGTMIESKGLKKMHVREIEVVEHLKGRIVDTIKNKLSKKQYEPNTVLVCFISIGGVYDFEKESEIISKEITSLENIFLVFNGSRISELPVGATADELMRAKLQVSLVQLKPVFTFSTVDPIDDCKDWREGKEGSFFILESIGKGEMRPITLENPPKLF